MATEQQTEKQPNFDSMDAATLHKFIVDADKAHNDSQRLRKALLRLKPGGVALLEKKPAAKS